MENEVKRYLRAEKYYICSMKKYATILQYMYQQLPMYQRVGATAFKKDLSNIKALCAALGNPEQQFRAIHIAGTNGKGSTGHLLSGILQAGGYKVGLYTSPHYRDFRERIKINGNYISKAAVVQFVEENKALFGEIRPSFFEITVALAFQYFAHQKVDIAIIETGLGGRLDSTNIIMPLLSVITNISFDHQQFLGDTLPEIASEKAGIIKANIPVIIGEEQAESSTVFEAKAQSLNAPLSYASQHIKVALLDSNLTHSYYKIDKGDQLFFEKIKINLHGSFQTKNIATALHTIAILQQYYTDFKIDKKTIATAFEDLKKTTNYHGRWQLLGQNPTIIADSAHNEGGLKVVMAQLQTQSYQQLHIVLGTVKDKKLEKILKFFPKDAIYYFAKAAIPRGLEAKKLQTQAAELGLKGRAYVSVKNALQAAKRKAAKEDLIFVGGSIFVVAELI